MRSGYRLVWSDTALIDLQNIIDYLFDKWTKREVSNFARQLDKRLELIVLNPQLYPMVEGRINIRRSVLTKQTIIYYEVKHDLVTIVRLFPSRSNPKKLGIKTHLSFQL